MVITAGGAPVNTALPMPVVSETLAKRQVLLERQGLRGVRGRDIDDLAVGPHTVEGTIVLEPTSAELVYLWFAAGIGTGVGVEPLPVVTLVIDRGVSVFTYASCKLSRLTLSSSQGGLLQASCDFVALDESVGGAVAEPATALPMSHGNSTLVIGAVDPAPCLEYTFTVDNAVESGRFLMGLTIPEAVATDRRVTLSATLPYNATNKALIDGNVAGVEAVLVIGDGTNTHEITMTKVAGGAETPATGGRSEITIPINLTAYKDAATTGEAQVVVGP